MNIADLKPRMGKVEVTGTVTEKSPAREFQKFGDPGKVCNAKLKDETGQVTITLWNEQVETVNAGDTIKITNGYVSEWQGDMQLSTGKFGTLEVVSKGAGEKTPPPKKQPPKPSSNGISVEEEEF